MAQKFQFVSFCVFGVLVLPQIRAFKAAFSPKHVSSDLLSAKDEGTQRTKVDLFATDTTNHENGSSTSTVLEQYEYDGWKLTYRKIAEDETKAGEEARNVLLIHPIGVGLASWLWEPFLTALEAKNRKGSKIRAYAPNLIGCGISEGSDAWDPDQRGMFVPLGWVKGCEALVNEINDQESKPRKWTVVTQGGLAPVGVLFATRNPELVENLVLTSPPTWKDMTNPVPMKELERNYNFLRSPILGKLAFSLLENRAIIEFFTNQFLFTNKCDDVWLDNTEREMCAEARPPVQNFNAGMCLNRSLECELVEDIQTKIPKVVVVQGANDKREREEYEQNLSNCKLVSIPGTTNVVPWEDPEALADFLVETIES